MDESGFSPGEPPRGGERRRLPDRRARPTPLRSTLRWGGQRRGFRRAGEGVNRYVDRPSTLAAAFLGSLLLLSFLDAWFTLLHLGYGGHEANPLMAFALGIGVHAFVASKVVLTGAGAMVLVAHERFAMARRASRAIIGIYTVLTFYHLTLFAGVSGWL